jgi:hypothetical protein
LKPVFVVLHGFSCKSYWYESCDAADARWVTCEGLEARKFSHKRNAICTDFLLLHETDFVA